MRVPRLYTPQALAAGAVVELDPRAANHAARVLRLRPGAPVILFNGSGGEYRAELERVARSGVRARVGGFLERDAESRLELVLAQGISRGERMNLTLQKAVELGITRIVPLWTERSQVRLEGERLERRMGHWQGVIVSACEQCGRTRLATLEPPARLDAVAWPDGRFGHKLLLDPGADRGLRAVAPQGARLTLLAGPEGGLSERERREAVKAGFEPVCMGPRILRTETAALAALAAIQALWGDLA